MARIDCLIDTNPMANEMRTVSKNIQETTAAVVGMKAAVIQAEQDAANHVCSNVNKGFYTLIHSQISQKIAKLQSDVDSHLMKLNQLRKQLLSIKGRMERDYGMISQRYIKLFSGLNKNLEKRVYELDKPIMEFAMKDINTISNRKKHMTATVPLSQKESLSLSQKILTSNMKFQGMRVIDSMSQFLMDMKAQDKLAQKILLETSSSEKDTCLMVPVIISESRYDEYGNTHFDVIPPSQGLNEKTQDSIRTAVNMEVMKFNWQEEPLSNEIKSEFGKYLSSSSASQRVKDMTNKLFSSNNFQIIKQNSHEL